MMTQRQSLFALLVLSLAFAQTACVKARSQIKSGDTPEGDVSDNSQGKPSAPPQRYEMEEVKNELTRISGKLEEVDLNQHIQNYGELKEYVAKIDGRVSELEKNQLLLMTEVK